jgi:hypothetical protein
MTLQDLIAFWREHGTKVLGSLAAFVATALLIPDLIPAVHMKYWLFANALLGGATVKRGFTNTAKTTGTTSQAGFVRPLMLAVMLAVAVPVTLFLPGCADLQQLRELSFDQKLQLSIDSAVTLTRSVGSAYDAQLITQKQASAYLDLVKDARDLFAIAVELKDSDARTAEGQLQLANDILLQLQRYLTEVQS